MLKLREGMQVFKPLLARFCTLCRRTQASAKVVFIYLYYSSGTQNYSAAFLPAQGSSASGSPVRPPPPVGLQHYCTGEALGPVSLPWSVVRSGSFCSGITAWLIESEIRSRLALSQSAPGAECQSLTARPFTLGKPILRAHLGLVPEIKLRLFGSADRKSHELAAVRALLQSFHPHFLAAGASK